jgi:hypothetical protein
MIIKQLMSWTLLEYLVVVVREHILLYSENTDSQRTMIRKQLMCRINEEANWMHKRRIHVSYEEEDT